MHPGFINARFNQMEGALIFISILDKAREFTYINRHLTVIFKPGGKLLGEIKKLKGLALDRRLGVYDHCVR